MLEIILRKINSLLYLKRKSCVNLFQTLYANVALLRLRDAMKFPILIYGKCYTVNLRGKLIIDGQIKRGMLKIGLSDPVRSFESSTVLNLSGTIHLKGQAIIRRGFHVSVNTDATLELGDKVFIADNGTIVCTKSISLGNNTRVGNNCVFMDTDFHYLINTNTKEVHSANRPICIGKNNWIAGFNVVKKGTITPEGTTVAGPYSMTSKDYTEIIAPYSIIGGSPAKLLKENFRRITNLENQEMLSLFFKENSGGGIFSLKSVTLMTFVFLRIVFKNVIIAERTLYSRKCVMIVI